MCARRSRLHLAILPLKHFKTGLEKTRPVAVRRRVWKMWLEKSAASESAPPAPPPFKKKKGPMFWKKPTISTHEIYLLSQEANLDPDLPPRPPSAHYTPLMQPFSSAISSSQTFPETE